MSYVPLNLIILHKGDETLQNLLTSIMATLALLTLAVYDFLSICRIFGKEKWTKRIYEYFFTNPEFNEIIVFYMIRPLILITSLTCFLFSGKVLTRIPGFYILIMSAPTLAVICNIKNIYLMFRKHNPGINDDNESDDHTKN